MVDVSIRGVGVAQFPDGMPVNDIRSFLQRKFPPVQNTQGIQPPLVSDVAGVASMSRANPFQSEGARLERRQQELDERRALEFPDPSLQEPGLGQVIIPGIEDLPADIAFTVDAIRKGNPIDIGTGILGSIAPGLSAAKLAAIIPLPASLKAARARDLKKAIETETQGLKLSLSDSPIATTIDKIVVPKESRNLGTGSKVMNDLAQWADSQGKTLALTPSADFGGSKKKLIEFYKRFGFVENKGRNKDFEISEAMIRLPQSNK